LQLSLVELRYSGSGRPVQTPQSISVAQAIYVRLSRDFYLGLQQLFNKFVVLKKNENC
jgi:hypothetical protein